MVGDATSADDPEGTRHARAAAGRARFDAVSGGIETAVEIFVAPDTDAEIRILSLSNRSERTRHVEVTTCLELALTEPAAFAAHPAFRKLFVRTDIEDGSILVAARRPRDADESPLFAAHGLWGDGDLQWETDRARFIGAVAISTSRRR